MPPAARWRVTALFFVLAMSELCLAGGLVIYTIYSDSNHTGAPLGDYRMLAAAGAVVGGVGLFLPRSLLDRRLAGFLLVSALAALLLLVGFEQSGMMMEYETWIQKGKPEQ